MESEKVKETKEKLQEEIFIANSFGDKLRRVETKELENLLTLINELVSENERLSKSDTSKEESSIEYYNLYKDFKRKNKDLNELCELQRVSIAESFVRENQLKDRIAELETKNKTLTDGIKQEISYKKVERDKLHRLVEDVKRFTRDNVDADKVDGFVAINIYLDKLLKEEIINESGN